MENFFGRASKVYEIVQVFCVSIVMTLKSGLKDSEVDIVAELSKKALAPNLPIICWEQKGEGLKPFLPRGHEDTAEDNIPSG